jgi:hypothetical protein
MDDSMSGSTFIADVLMSIHFSAANLPHPGDDLHLDLTDRFVSTAADNPDRARTGELLGRGSCRERRSHYGRERHAERRP